MKTLSLLCLSGLLLLSFTACNERRPHHRASGEKTETKALTAAFSNIQIDAALDTRITVGGAPTLAFRGPADALAHLHSEVKDGTLRIFADEQMGDNDDAQHLTATITMPGLTGIAFSGAGKVIVGGALNTSALALSLSGAGTISIDELHLQSLNAEMSGAGSLILRSGDIAAGTYEVSGSGEVRAFGVTQRSARVSLSGVAGAEINVAEKLDVEISGTGSVRYKGHPALTQDVSGVGSVADAN